MVFFLCGHSLQKRVQLSFGARSLIAGMKHRLPAYVTCNRSVGSGKTCLCGFSYAQNLMCWPIYSKTCVKRPLSRTPKIGFQDQLSLNACQKYCRMLQGEHSAILLTFIKLPFAINIFVCLFWSGRFTQVLLYAVETWYACLNKTLQMGSIMVWSLLEVSH